MRATKRRPSWILPFLAAITAALAAARVWRGTDRPTATPHVAAPPQAPPARVCVTRHGACSVGLIRAGDPCSCPYSLYGNVPGRVELVPKATGGGRPGRDEDPLESLGPLFGP